MHGNLKRQTVFRDRVEEELINFCLIQATYFVHAVNVYEALLIDVRVEELCVGATVMSLYIYKVIHYNVAYLPR